MKVTVLNGQSINDIVNNYYGTLRLKSKFCLDNGLSLFDQLAPGSVVYIDETIVDKKNANFFMHNREKSNNGYLYDSKYSIDLRPSYNGFTLGMKASEIVINGLRENYFDGIASAAPGQSTLLTFGTNSIDEINVTYLEDFTLDLSGQNNIKKIAASPRLNASTVGSSTFVDVKFYNETTGLACGFDGTIYRTTTGGAYWDKIGSGVSSTLTSIAFKEIVGQMVTFIAGYESTLLVSYNYGKTFEACTVESPSSTNRFTSCVFVGDELLISCHDTSTGNGSLRLGSISDEFPVVATYGFGLNKIHLTSTSAWVCGHSGLVVQYSLIDYSETSTHFIGDSTLVDIFAKSDTDVWVVGYYLAKKFNGTVWNDIFIDHVYVVLVSVQFFGATGYICGFDGSLLRTVNGGTSWDDINDTGISPEFRDMVIIGKNNIVCVCSDGIVIKTMYSTCPTVKLPYLAGTYNDINLSGCGIHYLELLGISKTKLLFKLDISGNYIGNGGIEKILTTIFEAGVSTYSTSPVDKSLNISNNSFEMNSTISTLIAKLSATGWDVTN